MSDLISRQDAIDKIREVYEYEFPTASGAFDEFVVTIIPNILRNMPSTEPEMKWIPVRDKLPKEEKKSYWVCTDTKYQCECRWTNNMNGIGKSNNYGWSILDIPQYTKVVAWMPLPEVYRGE